MKKYFFFFFLIVLCTNVFAQTTISGKVSDTDAQAVPSASVTVEEPGKDAIVAYAITNSKGEYKITFNSASETVDIKIKAFNHKALVKSIKNSSQNLNFSLDLEATEIKEVKLKTKLITKRGDTISYDLKAFENKSDRTLADVLKKIPGIQVNTDGSILYQGEAINKFYVNGKDLMEGGYGTINNSLPKDAVQKVEVMENHQPVKILQDKVPSEQAAINVKLKKSVTMTGRAEIGSGFADPWLWNLKLTPMFFGQKNQWVINYKTNNVGETVENEGNILSFGSRFEGRRMNVSQNNWLNVETADAPNLPEKRYLLNNVHYLSANFLTNPFKNKEWELKANASYTNNVVSRDAYSSIHYFQTNTDVSTNIANKFYTDKAKGEIIFTKNAKKGFFKNTTTFSQFWNADRADAIRVNPNVTIGASESLESPTASFQNSLSTIIPWKEKLVNVMSFINYQKDRQDLQISPSSYVQLNGFNTNSNLINQNLRLENFEADHSVNIGFSKKNWTFTPEVGFNFNTNNLNSLLSGLDFGTAGLNFKNDLKFTTAIPYASLGINYKSENWMLYSQFPVNFNSIKAEDAGNAVSKSLNKITFEPSFFAQYSFASFWKLGASGNLNYNFGDIQNNYAGVILLNPTYINAMKANNPIPETITKSVGSRLEYRNPLNNLFFNISYRYTKSDKNIIQNINNDGSGFSQAEYKIFDNQNHTNRYGAEIGKYFPKFKTNASFSFSNNVSHSDIFRNNAFYDNNVDAQSLTFKFNNAYFSWMSLDYNLTSSWNTQQNIFSKTKSIGYNHNLTTYFYPIANHTIGFIWDQINSSSTNNSYHNAFFDLSYQYTFAKKKVDFELKWINIANRKVFENYNINDTYTSFKRYLLRPSQVLFTVKFNF